MIWSTFSEMNSYDQHITLQIEILTHLNYIPPTMLSGLTVLEGFPLAIFGRHAPSPA